VPATGAQATYAGFKEAVNTVLGNVALSGVTQHVTGQDISSKDFGVTAVVSLLAGPRLSIYKYARIGERFAYRNHETGIPSGQRWLAATPIQWGFFSSYFVVQDGLRNVINGKDTPTEFDRSGSAQPFGDA
jgi:hypothetical protein